MRRQQGFLAVTAIVMIVLFGLLTAALVHMFVSGTESSAHSRAGNSAYSLANAGIEAGIYNLRTTFACSASVTSGTLTTGTYTYTCAAYTPSTTLSSAITASSTSIPLTSAASFANLGKITIGTEVIYYFSKSGNTLVGARRGKEGTTAQAASSGAAVSQNQYVITAVGYDPGQTNTLGKYTAEQAVTFGQYFAAGVTQWFYRYISAWAVLGQVGTVDVNAMACPTNTQCFAGGQSGWFYQWTGGNWSTIGQVGTNHINTMACPTTSQCFAAGQTNRFYTWSGASWSFLVDLGNNLVSGMACASSTQCFAVGDNGVIYSWTGGSWSLHTTLSGTPNLSAVACPTASRCFAVERANAGRIYSWAGSTWSLDPFAAGVTLNAIACPTGTNCQAAGNNGRFFKWNGTTWSSSTTVATGDNILSLACFSATNCQAGCNNRHFYPWNSTTDTWGAAATAFGGNQDILTIAPLHTITLITRN